MADQIFEEIPVLKKTFSLKERYRQHKKLFITGGIILCLIILLVLFSAFLPKQQPAVLPLPLPTPTPTPFEERITSPSTYATDSAILKIEAELKIIDQDLQKTDLKEAALNPPVLDMEVTFDTE